MILGFKAQFREPILAGTKIHTIREDKHDRWHAGINIQMATGVRTKNYECFREMQCLRTERIFMTYTHLLEITIGEKYLYHQDKVLLAKNDGFVGYDEFEDWFYKVIKRDPKERFYGKIIHWTDYKY